MRKCLLLLAALGLAHCRPQDYPELHEPHELCPSDRHYLLPHENDCTKYYYCEYGLKFIEPRDCASGTEFSFEEQVCVHPLESRCNLPENPTTPASSPADGTTPAESDDIELLENGCPADIHVHKLLPHEKYCHKFYYCVRGDLVLRTCAPGTYFNPEIQVCDHPWNVNRDCESPVNDDEDGDDDDTGDNCPPEEDNDVEDQTTEPETPLSTTQTPTTDSEDSEFLENGCPSDINVHKLLPHEKYCNKFYYCVGGDLVLRSCAPGTYFNPEIQVCDHPWNVDRDCESPEYDDDDDCTDDNCLPDDEKDDEDDVEDETEDEPIELLPNGCPKDFNIHTLLQHETDCDKFFFCVFGEKVERSCPNGTYFNFEIQVCDHPSNVNCTSGNPEGPGTTEEPDSDGGCDEDNGSGTTQNPGTTEVPNTTEDSDNKPWPTENPGTTEVPNTTEDSNNKPWPTENPGTTEVPNTTEDSDNKPWPTENPGTTTDSGYEIATTEGLGSTTDSNNGPGTTEAPVSPEQPGNKCKDECNVLPWAHGTDCDKYWICKGDQPLLIICQEGLHFNPATYTCDFMCNANCVREVVQATAGADGVKVFLPWDKVDNKLMKFLKLQ